MSRTAPQPGELRGGWSVVVAMALATWMAMLDMTVVAVALPVMAAELDVTPAAAQWIVLAYLVPLVGLSIPAGVWASRVDQRAALLLAVTGFAGASAAVGASPTLAALIAARLVQGVFAALLLAVSPAVAVGAVAPERRGRAMSLIATVGPLGAVAGFALGGAALDSVGWQGAFYANVPVAVVVSVLVRRHLPRGGGLRGPRRAEVLDGGLLVGAAVLLLGGLSLTAARGAVGLAVAVLAAAPAAAWCRRTSGAEVLAVLRDRALGASHLGLLAETVSYGAATFLLPFYLLRVQGAPPSDTGLILLALPLAMIVAGPVGGVLTDRFGARRIATVAAVCLTAALAATAPLSDAWSHAEVVVRLAFVGASVGLFAGANQTMSMSAAPEGRGPLVGASTSLTRQLGFSLGPAMATGVWALDGYGDAGLRHALLLATTSALLAAATVHGARPTRTDDRNRATRERTGS